MVGNRKTEEVYLKGKLSWIKHIIPEVYLDKSYWKVTIHPDAESLDKVRNLQAEGIKNHVKKDDDGWYVTFKRPTERKFSGRVEGMAPPKVIDKDSKPIEVRIGNGSDGVLKLEVYQHKTPNGGYAKAARFGALRIDNFLPFEAESDFSDVEKAELKTLREEPEQLF